MINQTGYENGYDTTAKILILGDSGVGKTCLTLRFCENSFITQYFTTVGIDFKMKAIELNSKRVKLQIWDTASQDRFIATTKSYYASTMGVVFMYACDDRDSFKNVENWITKAKRLLNNKSCLFLIASKCDVADRTVSYDEGQALADLYGMEFFETSAKEGTNVRTLFYCIAHEILRHSYEEGDKLSPIETKMRTQPQKKKSPAGIFPDWFSKICCTG